MSSRLRLSVLDQAPIRKGGTAAQAIAETIELARAADRLGYHRYWLAEHHNSTSLACASPEILVATLADRTERSVLLVERHAVPDAQHFELVELLDRLGIELILQRDRVVEIE